MRHLERRHTGWTCATIDIHFDEGWARNWPHSADLTIDLDDATIRKLIPADAPWTPPSISNATQLEVITSPHLWPRYPKLFLHRPGHEERGGEPRGHILDELRAVIHRGNEPALSYPDHRALYDAGWRIAGWPLEPTP